MARGWGTTYGVGATDAITTALTAHATQRTYAQWVYRNGSGGGGLGRIFDKRVSGAERELSNFNGSSITYLRGFSTARGNWTITDPGTGAWYHLAITFDSGSDTNNPTFYVNGSSVSVTEAEAPSGSATTNTDAYVIGNRTSDSARAWDGMIAEWAVWDRLISAAEAEALAEGASPLHLAMSLVAYVPLIRTIQDWKNANPTSTGTAAQPHPPKVYYPGNRYDPFWAAAAAPAGADALLGHLSLLGVGR